jgi:hypothetical protein
MAHSSIWIRNAAVASPQEPAEPFANFYFGGFGNNYVDHRSEQRYREYYALPGRSSTRSAARNFAKSVGRVESAAGALRRGWYAGVLSHVDAARPSSPAALVTNSSIPAGIRRNGQRMSAASSDFRLNMLSTLDLTLSVGGADRVRAEAAPRREAMISLKCSADGAARQHHRRVRAGAWCFSPSVVVMDSFQAGPPESRSRAALVGAVVAVPCCQRGTALR